MKSENENDLKEASPSRKHKLEMDERDKDHQKETKRLCQALKTKKMECKDARRKWLEENSDLKSKLNSMTQENDALK